MSTCRICKSENCDNDCEELALIYRKQQREKLRDIDPDEIMCATCGFTYGERSHYDCHPG